MRLDSLFASLLAAHLFEYKDREENNFLNNRLKRQSPYKA